VPTTPPEREYDQRILQAIASGHPLTQRALSRELGVALGLTNLLIRRLVTKGFVKMTGMGTRQVRYLMTTSGWEALGRLTRRSLSNTVHLYTQTREQIRATLDEVSSLCPTDAAGAKRVVFYGAGDVAEIAYVSLQRTDLTLIGVVDDWRTGRFFDLEIASPDRLSADALDGQAFSYVVVASIEYADTIRARLDERGVPRGRVCCL
jgi:DNA-binding MarR family transcriptional regulator